MDYMHDAAQVLEVDEPGLAPAFEHSGTRGMIVPHEAVELGAKLGTAREVAHLVIHHRERLAVAIDYFQYRAHLLEQLAARIVAGALMNLRDALAKLRDHRLGQQYEDVFL